MIQTLCCDHIGWFMKIGCDNLRKLCNFCGLFYRDWLI